MRIGIANDLPFRIHVTMVTHSPDSLLFIFSESQVPVPTGTIRAKFFMQPEEVVEIGGVPDGTRQSIVQHGLGEVVNVRYRYGDDEDGGKLAFYNVRNRPDDDIEFDIDVDGDDEDGGGR